MNRVVCTHAHSAMTSFRRLGRMRNLARAAAVMMIGCGGGNAGNEQSPARRARSLIDQLIGADGVSRRDGNIFRRCDLHQRSDADGRRRLDVRRPRRRVDGRGRGDRCGQVKPRFPSTIRACADRTCVCPTTVGPGSATTVVSCTNRKGCGRTCAGTSTLARRFNIVCNSRRRPMSSAV